MTRPLPANLPAVANARLPETYDRAKNALAECERIDECKDWADKAAAMASYAKQAQDTSLEKLAVRIKSRAILRCGELLKQVEPAQGKGGGRPRKDGKTSGGRTPKVLTRAQVAEDAGLSKDQAKQALRVASLPVAEFEEAVESDNPPTVTELAERGKKAKPKPLVDLKGRDPDEMRQSAYAFGHVQRLVEFARDNDPAAIARGRLPGQRKELASLAAEASDWLTQLIEECQ